MIFIKYDEYGHISHTQNITESIGQNSLKANTLYIAFPNVVQSYISMIKEYKCYITFKRSDGIKISDLPCTPVSKTIDGIEYFGYLYSFSSKQVTACAGSLIVSPRLFSINSDGEEIIAVIGANQTLSVSPSVVESEVVSNLSEAEKNALVDMIQNQHIMWLEKKYNNYSAIEVFTSLLENSMSDGIYVSFDRKRLFVYERTTESICFGEFIKNGIVKNETGIYKYDNEENFEYIKIDDLKTGNLSDLPFTANSIVEALNKIIDGTEQVGNAISADYAETSYNTYRDSEDNLIATYYASKSALSQANKEIANLKEALYGYVLDTTDIEISDIIPNTATIDSNTYNLVDNVYGLIKEVRGNTIKSENLLVLEDVSETTTNGITYSIKNGILTLNGTATADTVLHIGSISNFKLNDVFTIKTFNSSVYFQYAFYNNDLWLITSNKFIDNETMQVSNARVNKIELLVNISNGEIFNNSICKPMIVRGSTPPTEFKQGFDGLKSVTYNGTKIIGANLLNIADKTKIIINNSVDSLSLNLESDTQYNCWLKFKVNTYSNTENTISSNVAGGVSSISADISNSEYISVSVGNIYLLKFSFTTPSTFKVFEWRLLRNNLFGNQGLQLNADILEIGLFKGSTAPTKFKPYREPTTILTLTATLRGVGSAKDKIVITKNTDDEYYTATKITNIGEVDLGTLSWTYVNDSERPRFYTFDITDVRKPSVGSELIKGIAENYEVKTEADGWTTKSGLSINVTGMVVAYETTTPTGSLVYELATPTTEVISSTLTDSDVMPLLELGGSVDIVGVNGEQGSTIIEMVYRLSAATTTAEVLDNE